jgi:hypothetical protein
MPHETLEQSLTQASAESVNKNSAKPFNKTSTNAFSKLSPIARPMPGPNPVVMHYALTEPSSKARNT